MCGFVVLFSSNNVWNESILSSASQSMSQRGPDDCGEWWSDDKCIGIAHRRLSVIDLSSGASQPMESGDANYIIAFNGEIYNYKQLRRELTNYGVKLKTRSDTEVILEMYAIFGEECLTKLRGMFSFAIWDKKKKDLFIARDPYGIKPLYIAKSETGFIVASQVKALISTGVVSRKGCPNGQSGYWLLGSVPEPYTWFRDISAVPSGHCMRINKNGASKKSWNSISSAWINSDKHIDNNAINNKVEYALRESVGAHLVADVPIGVFLSAGVDSSSLVAIMRKLNVTNITGITLKYSEFDCSDNDETSIASMVAKQYGINHHIKVVSREEFIKDLPRIFSAMDQPSIDGINTWYAAKFASELGLKVVISGVGGDELFQGYDSFKKIPVIVKFWRFFSKVPGFVVLIDYLMDKMAAKSKNPRWSLFSSFADTVLGVWFLQRSIFTPKELKSLMKGSDSFSVDFIENFKVNSMLQKMTGVLSKNPKSAISQIESTCYLRNQLLRDCDWASMSHGVELRTPLVDSKLLNDLKPYLGKFHMYRDKSLLSSSLTSSLRSIITKRKKTGFGIPVNQWMKKDLEKYKDGFGSREWAVEVSKNVYKNI